MSWFAFTLFTVIVWGVGQIIIKKGLSSISPLWNILIGAIINVIVYGIVSLLHPFSLSINIIEIILLFVTPLLYMLFYYAINKGQLAFVGTIFAAYPIITALLSVIFLHESFTTFQYIMVLLVLSGGVLLASADANFTLKQIKSSWLIWGIVGTITTGIADFFAKVLITRIGVESYNFYYPLFYFLGFFVYFLVDKKGRIRPKNDSINKYYYTIFGILLLNIGMLSLNFAFSHGPATLVSSVSSSYAGITILLAYIFLKEKINSKQWIALSLMLIGIVFVNYH